MAAALRIASVGIWFLSCTLPAAAASADSTLRPRVGPAAFMSEWDAGSGLPATPIEQADLLDSFYFLTTWDGLQPRHPYQVQCVYENDQGREIDRVRFIGVAEQARWSFWCHRKLGASDPTGPWRVSIHLDAEHSVAGEILIRSTWRSYLQSVWARIFPTRAEPALPGVESPSGAHSTQVMDQWDSRDRQPRHSVSHAQLQQPLYLYSGWRDLEPGRLYRVECTATDEAGDIRHQFSFATRPRSSDWYIWCNYKLTANDPAGRWQLRMVLDKNFSAAADVVIEKSWGARILHWLNPAQPPKPRPNPTRNRRTI